MELAEKVVLVTGAGRGTGAAIARACTNEGASVVVTDIDAEAARSTAERLSPEALARHLDVSDHGEWDDVVAFVLDRFGRIDVLVNNAAVLHIGSVTSTDPETFRRVLDVNLVGCFLGIRAVTPTMTTAGRGSIVNIASLDALVGMNGLSAYAASKWGLRGLTKSAALELGRAGIRVNTVCPAGGNAAMFDPWAAGLGTLGDDLVHYLGDRALPREASLDEIAAVAVFLASDRASFVTGADVPVDGGHSAGSHLAGFDRL